MPRPTREGVVPWPDEVAAVYRAKGYWTDQPLWMPVRETADRVPDKVAVVDGDMRITYRELLERADGAAERLLALGLRSDDRILVQLPNCWEFIVLTLACFRIGVIPVMALPAHRQHELSYLAQHSESVALVVPQSIRDFDHQGLAEQIASETASVRHVLVLGADVHEHNVSLAELTRPPARPEEARERLDRLAPSADSVACFLLSGGTTGLPKLIARTHNDYAYNVRVTSAAAGVSEDTVYLVSLPASHNFPLACPGLLGALFAAGTVVTLPSPEPVRAFRVIEAEGVTLTAVVPAVAQRWIEHQEQHRTDQLRTLKVLQVGGSRLADELARKVRPVLGATLQQVFGMAEGLINTTRLDDDEDVIVATQGRPVSPADEVRVVDEDGADVRDGERGTLLTRGPYTPRGYYLAEEHNRKSFTADGWYLTGDIVVRRPDGNLTVQGRDKDMINRGGEKISGEEVENLIYRLPEVDLAAAVGMPDPVLGERVCVYVTLKPGAELDLGQVRRSMAEAGVAAYKHPERLVVVPELPLTKVGKIDKKQLRAAVTALLESEAAAGAPAAGR
jgi:2,3-dihydroxybenzoate-AMP ligase